MKKVLFIMLSILMLSEQCFAISDWKQGTGTDPISGTDSVSDIDANSKNYAFDPLDKLLTHHIWGITLTHTSDDVITLSAGEVTCSNGAGTIRRMRKNTATTTVDFTAAGVGGIDSGSARDDSSWFDIYAVADADATTFTAIAAKQGTALSDVTYYRYVGSVYNDASDNILNFYWFGNGNTVRVTWDLPIAITTTTAPEGEWSDAIACDAGMPSTARIGIFGIRLTTAAGSASCSIRPNGSTWATSIENSYWCDVGSNWGSQRQAMTDSSQDIQIYTNNLTAFALDLEGYIFVR